MGMLWAMTAASMPSARNHLAAGFAPASRRMVASGTPVHSLVLVRPSRTWGGELLRDVAVAQDAVARALDEADPGAAREALQLREREDVKWSRAASVGRLKRESIWPLSER
jgi:hypothetical protein